ncbi:hypothetical protein [Methanoregula sp.]|jgi:hypothetical protein|uniref:hypothetical protein n=1 Tax=Methanoregula sp. TaxID=2052170 RepID=UPI00356A12FE
MEKINICKNCRYWQKDERYIMLMKAAGFSDVDEKETRGYCKRYPPSRKEGSQVWPVVGEEDFCGEFKR